MKLEGLENPLSGFSVAMHDCGPVWHRFVEAGHRCNMNELRNHCLVVGSIRTDFSPERKRLQIERASHKSREATFVKLADKICNLRDMASSLPAGWDLARRRDYFEWAAVVDGLPNVNAKPQKLFEAAYAMRP